MQDILNQTPVKIVRWTEIQYLYNNKIGRLHLFLDAQGDWICFDTNKNDADAYLDIVLNAVNGILIGEE